MNTFPYSNTETSVHRSPMFASLKQQSVSGREVRAALMSYPLYKFDLNFNLIENEAVANVYKTLEGFFEQQQGSLSAFLYTDPSDSSVTAQSIGTGDGSTTAYQLVRTAGANGATFVSPVQNVNGTPAIYRNDWQGNQLMYSTARTNLVPRSEEFGSWSNVAVTVTANSTVAPDGQTTADTLAATTSTSNAVYFAHALALATQYTVSAYFKAGTATRSSLALYEPISATTASVDFNWSGGVPSTSSSSGASNITYTAMSASGWYRVSFTATSHASNASHQIYVYPDRVGTTGNVIAWGAEVKLGTISSYIKTTTAAASVTDYALGATGLVTFAVAPLAAALLTWTGSFYYRCRFEDDMADFEHFVLQLWRWGKCSFIGATGNKV